MNDTHGFFEQPAGQTTQSKCTVGLMLIVVDIGNTNIVWGVYDDRTLAAHWRLATDVKKTSDEYGILFSNLLTAAGVPSQRLSGAIISSVVPALTGTVANMLDHRHHRASHVGCWRGHRGACRGNRSGWILTDTATDSTSSFRDAGNRHVACG